ncbi:ADP-ribose glycohydrolase MACROD2 isoform X1 [Hypomesus transpacificus]|uniref:ADP-ribose glycohydrolase MACROD2 isoform X1 n=1 Tax=Hypomesus transpacificus TaxID=137520 RepID=UPI001F0778E1|nr:ADP-ribose glycohydrolase MACROD2 isoform X1 [Hypomesus transpacificus]
MNKKKKDWKEEKVKLLNMSLEERRRQYRSDHVTLEKILTWRQMSKAEVDGHSLLIDKVSLYKGDITILEVDAIVNAGVRGQVSHARAALRDQGGVRGELLPPCFLRNPIGRSTRTSISQHLPRVKNLSHQPAPQEVDPAEQVITPRQRDSYRAGRRSLSHPPPPHHPSDCER